MLLCGSGVGVDEGTGVMDGVAVTTMNTIRGVGVCVGRDVRVGDTLVGWSTNGVGVGVAVAGWPVDVGKGVTVTSIVTSIGVDVTVGVAVGVGVCS